jgi:hypothetical protein
MKKIVIFLLLLLIFSSCTNDDSCRSSVKILFNNQTNNTASLTISNEADSVQISSKSNSSETKDLCFNKAPKTDGNYRVHIKTLGKDTVFYEGYYTNGYPEEKSIEIVYKKDSILFKSNL